MSRKPPKLVPFEGKANSNSNNPPNRMPSLKHGGVAVATNNAGSSTRRSAPTRHFLNCNGSGRRRFPTKLSPPSPDVNSESVKCSSENATANGCSSSDETCTTKTSPANAKTANGTICNGVTSNTKEVSRVGKKSKNVEKETDADCSTTSDSLNSSVTNGNNDKETTNNVVSSSSHISNNNNSNVISERRTSRFSQSSVGSTKKVTSCSTQETPPVDIKAKGMPDLVKGDREDDNDTNIVHTPDSSDTEIEIDDDDKTLESSAAPKIIRQGDTVITSYVDEKTGKITVFEKGMKLEVCDFGSGTWYPAKVKNIDWIQQQILVHYSNWSARFDEWISMKSNRVRPSKNTNVVRLQFDIGEKVEAVWHMDSKRYSATVTQVLLQDMYEVTFDDGIKIKRSANQIFKVSPSDKKPIAIQIENNKSDVHEQVKTETVNTSTRKRGVKTRVPQRISPVKEIPPIKIEDPITEAQLDNPNRPHHFSVFDLPQGELGKRKRKVHDYSVLVKGRAKIERCPRKSKSEGNIAVSPTREVFEPDPPEPIIPEDPPEPKIEHVPVPVVRRRKGSGTGSSTVSTVPVHQRTSDKTKELPPEVKELENSTSELTESPSKKKKQSLTTRSTSQTQNNVEATKPKLAPVKAEPAPPEVQAPVVVTSAPRRTKSLGTVPTINLTPIPVLPSIPDAPEDKGTDSGFIDGSGNPVLIGQATDGFWKCPLPNCGKNFRKDSLLKMHFKHYHPELKVPRGIANVVQMAQARTAYENEHPSDQFYWPKLSASEQQVTTQSPLVSPAVESAVDVSQVSVDEKVDTPIPSPQKRSSSKALHNSKEVNVDKPAPATTPVDEPVTNSVIGSNAELSQTEPKVLSALPRLRLSRKRNFAFANYGRVRAKHSTPVVRKEPSPKRDKTPAMTTVEATSKKAKLESPEVLKVTADEVNSSSIVDTPNSLVSTVNNLLHDNNDVSSDKPSTGSSGFNTEPFLVPCESETLPLRPNRSARGRWSKPHIRRGLMSSNIRRVGTGVLQNSINSTSLFIKKRMQFRKFIGRRGRQRKTSLLSRISSGRMRVILEALNQRSLKRKRFKATRRCRDVKVDVINCICNNKTEFGLMIQCELCLCWQHGSCFNVQSNSQLPEYYACQSCAEPRNIRHSRKNEWAISEFYKLGKLPSFPMGPNFPKEDARVMKQCTNLTSNLMEVYSMIQGLKLKERICFGKPEHPQLYQWTTERSPPQEEIQKDRFQKYFKPVLRRLLLEKKSDPTYSMKLRKLADSRGKLKKYADAVESARSTIKKKLGCRAAAFLEYVCDGVLSEMIKAKRSGSDDSVKSKKETADSRKLASAENAYVRLLNLKEEIIKDDFIKRNMVNEVSAENGTRTYNNDVFSTSPVKCDLGHSSHLNKLSRQPNLNNSTRPNGTKKDVASAMKDLYELKKYLKQKRTIDTTIRLSLARRAKQFPDDWKNLMKMARGFIEEGLEDKLQEGRSTWVLTVIRTYNTLRILLKQIYSEENSIKQRNCCSEFEKTTIRLFDLFGIGLTEERLEAKKLSHPNKFTAKPIKGLETLDLVEAAAGVNNDNRKDLSLECSSRALKSKNLSKLVPDVEEQLVKKVNPSTKLATVKDGDDSHLTVTNSNGHRNENGFHNSSSDSQSETVSKSTDNIDPIVFNKLEFISNSLTPDMFLNSQSDHDLLAFQFSDNVQLAEAVKDGANITEEEHDEQLLNLTFETQPTADSPSKSGIIPVPLISKITPESCKKNLVRDILLQQQQIDLYMDKIEVQIMKLSSQSRNCCDVSSMKASQLSSQRDKLLQSLELVIQLSKTVIGENDAPEPANMDFDDDTTSDSSDYDSSFDSDDDDNTSNYSGSDTETADEGDDSGDDELLDV